MLERVEALRFRLVELAVGARRAEGRHDLAEASRLRAVYDRLQPKYAEALEAEGQGRRARVPLLLQVCEGCAAPGFCRPLGRCPFAEGAGSSSVEARPSVQEAS